MIQLTEAEYKRLIQAEKKLRALEAGGVDNWEGYDTALEGYADDEDESHEDIYGDEDAQT